MIVAAPANRRIQPANLLPDITNVNRNDWCKLVRYGRVIRRRGPGGSDSENTTILSTGFRVWSSADLRLEEGAFFEGFVQGGDIGGALGFREFKV
jgi:hypothetical protein